MQSRLIRFVPGSILLLEYFSPTFVSADIELYQHTNFLRLQNDHDEDEEEMPELVSDPDDDFQESQPHRSRFHADFPFAG